MRKNPQIFWTLLLLVIVVCIVSFFSLRKNKESGSVLDVFSSDNSKEEQLPLGEGEKVESSILGKNKYVHSQLGFSFEYPKDVSISSFGNFYDSNGQTVLLQKKDSSEGLQVLITPFDEDIQLSIKRIKKDLPKLNITSEKEESIGEEVNNVQIVTFRSDNNLTTGKSIEGWFVYRKNLYQISSTESSDEVFNELINSWKLEE
jgi:hypothetical protein